MVQGWAHVVRSKEAYKEAYKNKKGIKGRALGLETRGRRESIGSISKVARFRLSAVYGIGSFWYVRGIRPGGGFVRRGRMPWSDGGSGSGASSMKTNWPGLKRGFNAIPMPSRVASRLTFS